MKAALIVPVWNEEAAIGRVLAEVPPGVFVDVIVVDGGSVDSTVAVARAGGARVVLQQGRGYGAACLTGARATDADLLVFLDGDYSDPPAQVERLLRPLREERADLVLGSRELGRRERGALPLHARIGNRIAVLLIRAIYGASLTDLPSFKAIRRAELFSLGIIDLHYGWTAEMVARAARQRLRIIETPIDYRARLGTSKVSGTLSGSAKAGLSILRAVVGVRLRPAPVPSQPTD